MCPVVRIPDIDLLRLPQKNIHMFIILNNRVCPGLEIMSNTHKKENETNIKWEESGTC